MGKLRNPNETERTCTHCKQTKPLDQFEWIATGNSVPYRRGRCFVCAKESDRIQSKKNKMARKESYKTKPEIAQKAKDRANRYYAANREKCKERIRARAKKPEIKKQTNESRRRLWKTSLEFRVSRVVRTAIWRSLKGAAKSARCIELTGLSTAELMKHIELLWKPGMNWDNWGPYDPNRMTWHIDHIIPLSYFNMLEPAEQKKCFHWSNLQPLWALDNIKKGDWVPDYQI